MNLDKKNWISILISTVITANGIGEVFAEPLFVGPEVIYAASSYAPSGSNRYIYMFNIDPQTGLLTPLTEPVINTNGIGLLTIDPSGNFLYGSGWDKDLKGYALGASPIDQSNFSLTSFTFMQNPGNTPGSLAFTPSGQYAYIGNYNNKNGTAGTITAYRVNDATGMLELLPDNYIVAAGNNVQNPIVDPQGKFVYIPNSGDNTIGVYQINYNVMDGPLGSLKNIQTIPSTNNNVPPYGAKWPMSLIFASGGQFAYVRNLYAHPNLSSTIASFKVDPATGLLTYLQEVPTGQNPANMILSPDNRFLYVICAGAIYSYQIDPVQGTLLAQTPLNVGGVDEDRPVNFSMSPDGRNLYVPTTAGNIYMIGIANDGTLSLLTPASVQGGMGIIDRMIFSQNGQFGYAVNGYAYPNTEHCSQNEENSIAMFKREIEGDNFGLLTPVINPQTNTNTVPVGQCTYSLTVSSCWINGNCLAYG
ncbi:6-phosphogluconolactonase [Legionella massiliensis]|uniref:6-phosphogluconolactonase n=1 Tax=Legionella massiliensis TaxID=1034943 RepID=A0A078KV20_9GAMM|nr:beta-propeller fold lactonase family protein [Legionella massiliensis]CDZ76842.1 6-phosphogluconolactonase [Legionella massiliensis]CEE12580.1 6-phosphogluconolactonase [Legionella massiliensis]